LITRNDIVRELTAYGAGQRSSLTLAEVAVRIGALERPALPLDRYTRHLQSLADKVGTYARTNDGAVPVAVMAEALCQVLARHMGYGGGETGGSDEDCFELSRVIDNREGSAEALSILYAESARRLGWKAQVLRVHGRTVVRVESLGERLILDPLGMGRVLEPADLRAIIKAYAGMESELTPNGITELDDKAALLGMMAGRKSVLLRSKRLDDAATLIDCALMISPSDPTLWRECGLLNARRDRIRDAISALEEYLRLGAGDDGRYTTTMLLQELRGRLS
jgi:regulator of sirC expression with transglutaminase-like and TPR domain